MGIWAVTSLATKLISYLNDNPYDWNCRSIPTYVVTAATIWEIKSLTEVLEPQDRSFVLSIINTTSVGSITVTNSETQTCYGIGWLLRTGYKTIDSSYFRVIYNFRDTNHPLLWTNSHLMRNRLITALSTSKNYISSLCRNNTWKRPVETNWKLKMLIQVS
jgi:hypothetical protein